MTSTRVLKALALTGVLALSVTACGSSGGKSKSGGELIKDGTLTVCTDSPYAPFEDFDKSSKLGFKGFDVDIMKAVAKDLDLKLVYKKSDFNALQSGTAMNSGSCDVAASAMTITPERAKKIGFSDPYYDSQQSLLVPADSDIKSIDDLDGRKVGVQKATTGEAYLTKHNPKAKRTGYDNDGQEFQALQAGNVEALLQDLPINLLHAKDGKYKVVQTFKTDETYGLAMKKTNKGLIKDVNKALKSLRSSGDYKKLYDKYFKTT